MLEETDRMESIASHFTLTSGVFQNWGALAD